MAKAERDTFFEITGLIIIRIACISVCICFGLPMFKSESIPNYILSGFGTILGVPEIAIFGNKIALTAFLFPIAILVCSAFLLFLEKHMYTIIFISGVIGILLSIAYFISTLGNLNKKQGFFDFNFQEIQTGITWGCLVILGLYAVIIIFSLLCMKVAE